MEGVEPIQRTSIDGHFVCKQVKIEFESAKHFTSVSRSTAFPSRYSTYLKKKWLKNDKIKKITLQPLNLSLKKVRYNAKV